MPSEKRLIRPFIGIEGFGALTSEMTLRVGPTTVVDGDTMIIQSNSLLHDPPVIRLTGDRTPEEFHKELLGACEQADLSIDEIMLLILVSTPYLRMADVVGRLTLSNETIIPEEFDLRDSETPARAMQTPVGGVDVQVVLALANDRDPQPLRPTRKGTWLGRATFRMRTELGELGLSPVPLTAEQRDVLRLGPNTSRFIQLDDPDALLEQRLDDALTLYVDDQVLVGISKSPDSPVSRSLQVQLFLDVMGAVVRACSRWTEFRDMKIDDLDGTAVGALIRAGTVNPSTSPARAELEESLTVLRSDPEMFLARIDDRVRTVDALRLAVGGFED